MMTTLLTLLLLLCGSAFFSGSETAMMSLGRARARVLVDQGQKRANTLLALLKKPNRLLATLLVGNNLVNIAASAISTAYAIKVFGAAGPGIAVAIMTVAVLVFGEILPKSYAAHAPDKISLLAARPIQLLSVLLSPVVTVFTKISSLFLRLFGQGEASSIISEEEIRSMISIGSEQGVLEQSEGEIIHNVFEFTDTVASEVMIPRVDMAAVEVNATVHEAAPMIIEQKVVRLAAYEGDRDNIVGMVHLEDLFKAIVEEQTCCIGDLARPALVVPESKGLHELFEQMRQERISSAMVVDEYGVISGVIFLEDLIEYIVGELKDEHDQDETSIETVNEKMAIVNGRLSIEETNEALGIDLPEEDIHTLGGWIFHTLGRLPVPGDIVRHGTTDFKVESMDRWRVDRVRVRLNVVNPPPPTAKE